MNLHALDDFTTGYIECALWSSTDDDGNPLDDDYGPEDIAPDSLASMVEDCTMFQRDHARDLEDCDASRAGHDFWLTRNRHGAGYWDGDYPQDIGRRLTDAAHAWGSSDLYVGDDGMIHAS
jgi:hypothetical protein